MPSKAQSPSAGIVTRKLAAAFKFVRRVESTKPFRRHCHFACFAPEELVQVSVESTKPFRRHCHHSLAFSRYALLIVSKAQSPSAGIVTAYHNCSVLSRSLDAFFERLFPQRPFPSSLPLSPTPSTDAASGVGFLLAASALARRFKQWFAS